ncbi:hypothetical protein PRZ48_009237 [Zasmidium cellare]|uniref:Uncharacterized protein n=1 Tax=Zasmidium cellare TaxID=395010 RepID=A0ABR0EB61_ZASCE|nr:hypothetical protein PRZ48_009237 [Zasmidium cellare]
MAEEKDVDLFGANADRHKIFPFFNLARELRDAIYDECMEDRTIDGTMRRPEILAQNIVSPTPLLVNRQFSAEYASRAKKCGILTFTDKSRYAINCFQLPKVLCKWQYALEVKIWCPWPQTPRDQRIWIDDVLSQVSSPRSLSITAVCGGGQDVESVSAQLNTTFWAAIPELISMQAYQDEDNEADLSTMWEELSDFKYIGTWSKNHDKADKMQVI